MKFPTKPPVVQRKQPVAPPVYRPQPVPKVLQRKVALAQPARPAQKVPPSPVHRPQPARIQAKTPPNIGAARAIQRRTSNTIQREVVFSPGSRTNLVNVAESVGRLVDFAITRTDLNGIRYPGRSRGAFVAALLPPRLRIERSPESVAVSVEAVPVQRVSFAMELPTRDGWEMNVTAQNIKVKLENQDRANGVVIPIGSSESGSLTLTVRGHPNDGTFADMVRTHEDVHVRDIQRAVNAVLRPWDARLNNLRRLGTRFAGPTEMVATAKLYEAAGGTPEEIGDRFAEMLQELGDAFHDTQAGKGPVIVGIARRGMLNRTLEVTLAHRAALGPLHQRRIEEERERERFEEAVAESLRRPVQGPINSGDSGNTFITNDML